jgi:bifunctional dethiobiotin synthetase / adenosylmethionine---8-amino-7-oxononanoate aminotransferase
MVLWRCKIPFFLRRRCLSTHINPSSYNILPNKRTNLIFGANTDVGKTLVSAGLLRASLRKEKNVHYIKPLQCGGSDQAFIEKHCQNIPLVDRTLQAQTLFRWETPASPHVASIQENIPCSDAQMMSMLQSTLNSISNSNTSSGSVATYIETAGGVLSPSAASPENVQLQHTISSDPSNPSQHWGWTLQADLYQPLIGYAPVILVGDGRLGGISVTISALESIILRGYDVAALIFLEPSSDTIHQSTNVNALRDYVSSRQLRSGSGEALFPFPSQSVLSLPPIPSDPAAPLHDWYDSDPVMDVFSKLEEHLSQSWEDQVYDLRSTVQNGSGPDGSLWLPGSTDPSCSIFHVDSSHGNSLQVIQSKDTTSGSDGLSSVAFSDASASCWSHGALHGDARMGLAIGAAAGRYGHVSGTPPASCVLHTPALALAQACRNHAPWSRRVFFTEDGGSLAAEVAINMGIQTYQKRLGYSLLEAKNMDWIVAAQEGCYHGDTLGAMNVAEPFVDVQHPWYQWKSTCLATPTLGYINGRLSVTTPDEMELPKNVAIQFKSIEEAMNVGVRSLSPKLLSLYKEWIEMQWLAHEDGSSEKIGAVIIEPLLQCAGGMKFVDPLFQRAMMDVADSREIPIILDESNSGWYRLGIRSAAEVLLRDPDIIIFSKLLTGGVLPLSAIVTNQRIYEACSEREFLFNSSFVANPLACAGALQALSDYEAFYKKYNERKTPHILFDEQKARRLSLLPQVKECFTLGSVLTITLQRDDEENVENKGYATRIVEKLQQQNGILVGLNLINVVGDVIYVMVSPLTAREKCNRIADAVYEVLKTTPSLKEEPTDLEEHINDNF